MVIPEIICEGGNDKELSRSHSENPDKILPTSDDWVLWAQYAVWMACMKQYSERSQSAQVFFRLELWWSKVCLEQLNAPFFLMEENLLIYVGARGIDHMKPRFNNLMKREGFQFNGDSFEDNY